MAGATDNPANGTPEKRLGAPRAASPARWAAASVLGGVSLIGMLWATVSRVPAPPTGTAYATPGSERAPAPRHVGTDEPTYIERVEPDPSGPAAAVRAPGSKDQGGPDAQPAPRQTLAPTTIIQAGTDRLDINTASAAQLELLPRIGPALAARIIAFRDNEGPIRSLTHLADVDGIGIRTIELIEPYLRFD